MSIVITAALIFLVIGTVFYFVSVYNGLIVVSRNIDKAWANIDVLLKQRHDEIPKLISVCEGYMKYERETLEKITEARTSCIQAKSVGESSQAEGDSGQIIEDPFCRRGELSGFEGECEFYSTPDACQLSGEPNCR